MMSRSLKNLARKSTQMAKKTMSLGKILGTKKNKILKTMKKK